MNELNNHGYYLARASKCRAMAAAASSHAIAEIHREFADRYDALALLAMPRMPAPVRPAILSA